MQDDDNVSAPADDGPQVIPNEEPLPPPDEHEAKAKKPESQEDEPSEDEPEDSGDGDEPAEDEDKPKRKRPGKYQRTVSRLESRLEQQDRLIRELVGRVTGGQQPVKQVDAAPKQEDFTDYAAYLEARAEWKAQTAARQLIDQERQNFQRSQQQRSKQATQAAYWEKVEAARDKYDDFDDVAFDDSVPITDPMADAIQTAENGPDINYYLGTHPDEARKISRMDPVSQVRAIGRLEQKLLTPSPKKTTSAPKPVKPLGGTAGGGVGSNDPSKMSMEEYVKWRAAGNG